jgi:hypothetical protein
MAFWHNLLLSSYTGFVGIAINGLRMFVPGVACVIPATGTLKEQRWVNCG